MSQGGFPGILGMGDKPSWVVVSNIFYFHPYLGKIPILTNIYFSKGLKPPTSKVFIHHQAFLTVDPNREVGYPGAAALAPHDIGPRDPSGTVDQGRNPPNHLKCGVEHPVGGW